jgi:hypothetical protein
LEETATVVLALLRVKPEGNRAKKSCRYLLVGRLLLSFGLLFPHSTCPFGRSLDEATQRESPPSYRQPKFQRNAFLSKQDFLGKHRVFLDRPILEDLFWLIHDDQPASKRLLLKYGTGKGASNYWVIPP